MSSEQRELGGLISVIHRKTQIYLNQELKQYGLNSAEFVYLIHIGEDKPMELRALGAHLRMDDAQTTRVIRSLEDKGLVRKRRSELDRRALDVQLTDEGRRVKPLILADMDGWIALITQGLEPQATSQLIAMLKVMAGNACTITEGK